MAPDSTTSVSWEYIAPVDNGELIFAGTFSAKDDYYGTYDPEVYIFGPGADIIADGEEKLDLSLTYNTVTAGGTNLTFTVFGNDILEDGAYIVRPFDAGAFAFATPQKRQHFGISLTAEF